MSDYTRQECPDQCPLQEGCPGQRIERRQEGNTHVTYQICDQTQELARRALEQAEQRHALPIVPVRNPA